jgi:hypothetical protein
MKAHAPGKMAEEFMIFRRFRENADTKRCIGEAFLYTAYEFYDFLTQEKTGGTKRRKSAKPANPTDGKRPRQGMGVPKTHVFHKIYCKKQ